LKTDAAPRRYGDYVLLESLGRGGMSAVDLARRSVDSANYVRFLVIKRILRKNHQDPIFVRMFMDEARINAELQHENIAQVYDFGENNGEWYLAMEYVPGVDLRQIQKALAKKQSGTLLPPRIALRVLHDVLSALQYAHDRFDTYGRPMRIVHRDVNPRNIMISVRGEVKLIDFGVAKADTRHDQTTGQTIKGKFAYMAPEQIDSGKPIDGRTDLFAVGLLLQELLTGTHPFRHLSEIQIIHRLMADRIEPMPDAPAPLDAATVRDVRNRVLSSNPDMRHPDARSLQEDLMRLAAPIGGLASRSELAGFFRRADPETADRISQRLQHWKDTRSPPAPLRPDQVDDGESLGIPDDTWASDARTAEVPKDWVDPHDGTVADPSGHTGADPLGSNSKDTFAPPEESQSASSLVMDAEPRRGLSVVGALGIGGGLGLLFIGLLAMGFVMMTQSGDQPTVLDAPTGSRPAEPPPPDTTDTPAGAKDPPDKAAVPPTESPEAATDVPKRATPKPQNGRPPKKTPPTPNSTHDPRKTASDPKPVPDSSTSPESSPPVEAADPPAEEANEAPPTAVGFLFATSRPRGIEVWVAGKKLGLTPLRNHPLPAGSHTVVFRDPVSGETIEQGVQIVANQPAHISAKK